MKGDLGVAALAATPFSCKMRMDMQKPAFFTLAVRSGEPDKKEAGQLLLMNSHLPTCMTGVSSLYPPRTRRRPLWCRIFAAPFTRYRPISARAATTIMGPDFTMAQDFMRLYFDMADFRLRLHREIVDETYPILSQPQQEQNAVSSHEILDTAGVEDDAPPWGTEVGDRSPWGKVQMSGQFADGVYEISTAGHGGIMIREADAEKPL